MGQAPPSTEASDDGSTPTADFRPDMDTDQNVSQTDAAFAEAYKDDKATLEGIKNVVAELENYGKENGKKKHSPELVKKAEQQAAEAKKEEERMRQSAEAMANRWIKQETKIKGVKPFDIDFDFVEAFEPLPRPKPMVLDWSNKSLDAFLADSLIEETWDDLRLGPLLREFLDRLKHDPAAQHGVHPDLAAVFSNPQVEKLLKSLRKEKGIKLKTQAPAGPVPEFYALLGVDVDATFEEIKKGYRKEALRWHPDKNQNKAEATLRFQKINEAFDTLFDPQKRESYDSGEAKLPTKAKKLQGHGWANYADEDDQVLTKEGLRAKMKSWNFYYNAGGRIDDKPEDLVTDKDDPRYPAVRIMCFWRWMGELAWEASDREGWMTEYMKTFWKDTPSHWPKAEELQKMNEASQQEWKERRMVYNRRKHKVKLHMKLHQEYLDIPDREDLELERMNKMRGVASGKKLY